MIKKDGQSYDVIIIGGGLSGLTAAALLTQKHLKVLVLEQHYYLGGCAHTFKRKNYVFDTAIHVIGGAEDGGEVHNLYNQLGIRDQIEFLAVDPLINLCIDKDYYPIPANLQELGTLMCKWFPTDSEAITTVLDEILYMGSLKGNFQFEDLKKINELERVSYKDYLSNRFNHPHCEKILSSLILFAGSSIDELSTFKMMNIMASYHGGGFYPKGSSQQLSICLRDYILKNGGDVQTKRTIKSIDVKGNQVKGVIDHKGNYYKTQSVISSANYTVTMNMVNNETVKQKELTKRQLKKLKPSNSAVILFTVIKNEDLPEPLSHETVLFSEENIYSEENMLFNPQKMDGIPVISISCPSLSDLNLAPEGYSIVTFMSLCNAETVESIRNDKGKDYILEFYLNVLEQKIPELRNKLVYHEFSTPSTIKKFTFNPEGAVYGWKKTVNQQGMATIGSKVSIDGVYFTGHWSQDAHGAYGVMRSGRKTAENVLNSKRQIGVNI
ncbi:phytoene desaturase family protein [Halalkalibacter alkalisediminis]|uniref:Phytoene desaturase family protein n=1 Tax=Halalkalibacter alkalisediminis TaxID=935616 RepID=A0ABV6NKW0_9BACI|nr:NAD(P)/FAD-dependent oxidoreductase [Halalkalibacter alkalisediminis]